MGSLITIFEHYMETGGIIMVPLVFCCLWMWVMIFYHLPLWQTGQGPEIDKIKAEFYHLKTGCRRHDRALLWHLQDRSENRRFHGISTINVLAALSPFLGLLGTVSGMIKTFQSVSRFGLANPMALAGGISEAMVTTQFGLFIAVPGIFAGVFLKRSAARRQAGIRQKTNGLLPE